MTICAKVKFYGGSMDGGWVNIPCDGSGKPLPHYDYWRALDPTRPPLPTGMPATVDYMLVKLRDFEGQQFEYQYHLRQ